MTTPTPEVIDQHLNAVLQASGSALHHYTTQKTLDGMRAAMRTAMTASAPVAPTQPSPTAGMNMPQRILHVGGRNPPGSTYVEFGSIQAVEALVKQVLRDLPDAAAAESQPITNAEQAAWHAGLDEGRSQVRGAAKAAQQEGSTQ